MMNLPLTSSLCGIYPHRWSIEARMRLRRRRGLHRLVAAVLVIASTTPALAMSGRVACASESLMLCQDEYCSALFDAPSKPDLRLLLDFDRASYRIPELATEPKPMRITGTEQTEKHDAVRFVVELADAHTGNVAFIANTKDDGRVEMSAAIRRSYPGDATRSAITAMTALRCARAAD